MSYVTIIGWVIAYLQYKSSKRKSALASYHLVQGLGVFIFALIGFLPLILLIFGNIAANNDALTPAPLIVALFEGKFNF